MYSQIGADCGRKFQMEGQRRGRKSTLSYCVQKSIEEFVEISNALDSKYYGITDFNEFLKDALQKLSVEQVNQ